MRHNTGGNGEIEEAKVELMAYNKPSLMRCLGALWFPLRLLEGLKNRLNF